MDSEIWDDNDGNDPTPVSNYNSTLSHNENSKAHTFNKIEENWRRDGNVSNRPYLSQNHSSNNFYKENSRPNFDNKVYQSEQITGRRSRSTHRPRGTYRGSKFTDSGEGFGSSSQAQFHRNDQESYDDGKNNFFRGRGRGNFSTPSGSYSNSQQEYYQRGDESSRYRARDRGSERPPAYVPPLLSDEFNDVFSGGISEGIDFEKYRNVKVQVSGGDDKQDMIKSFDAQTGIHPSLISNIKFYGYRTPTPIQKFTIPIILKRHHDLMGCAQTGSGKTAAFLIPSFSCILEDGFCFDEASIAAPYLLVIAPTRELVNQIWLEMRKFSYKTPLRTSVIYGGVSFHHIAKSISRGCDILAATPGRLIDFVNRGLVTLSNVAYLVLDEADRMLDMGFIKDIRKIIFSMGMPDKSQRRCYMFSATFPTEIQRLATEILAQSYYFVTVGIVGGAADTISQKIVSVMPHEKRDTLIEILQSYTDMKVLVFVETKRGADFLTAFLCQRGINSSSIHGDRYQEQREEALKNFVSGSTLVLVATSVAARGLDIPGVDAVINFDMPSCIEEYVHRIGRTGRLGNKGESVSFFNPGKDDALAEPLSNQEIPSFLSNYSPSVGYGTSSFVHSKDDRSIPRKSYRAYATNSTQGQDDKISCIVEAQEDEWE